MKKLFTLFALVLLLSVVSPSQSQAAADVAIERILAPTYPTTFVVGQSYTVSLRLKSVGDAAVVLNNAVITFTVPGATVGQDNQITGTVTATIQPGATFDFTFPTQLAITKTPISTNDGSAYLVFQDADVTNNALQMSASPTTAVDALHDADWSLYPNPSMGALNIQLGSTGFQTAELLDAAGRTVYVQEVNALPGSSLRLALNAAPGIYTLRLRGPQGSSQRRLFLMAAN